MLKKILSYGEHLLHTLFPERNQEKIVKHITEEDILSIPRANPTAPHITSLFSYKHEKVQALIWEIKYHRNTQAIQTVSRLLGDSITGEISDRMLFEKSSPIILVPIPMTFTHLTKRGYSQTDLLCREIKKYIPDTITYVPDALKKIKETSKQNKTHSKHDRLKNLIGAFQAHSQKVSGKTIILIDDVTTTGATITEATRALKEAGAKQVIAFTIAH